MIKGILKLVAATDGPSRKLRMSRGLRLAVRDLRRFAWEEEKRKSASCDVLHKSYLHKAWGL